MHITVRSVGVDEMTVLQLVLETKLHALLPDCGTERRLEASGVLEHKGELIVIFDNASQLARIDSSCAPNARNAWLGDLDGRTGHEDITYNPRQERFYVLIETTLTSDGVYQSEIVELDQQFVVLEWHPLPWEFASDNKGFEGLAYVQREGQDYVLALCEGNRCRGGDEGKRPGKGRIQIFQRGPAGWLHAATLKLPPSVDFTDYSSLDLQEDRVAVLSQESARLWLGTLHPTEWAFVDEGHVHALPRKSRAKPSYCTPEGVSWLGSDLLAVVSDRRKKGYAKRCAKRDQSVHLFRVG